jgi:hypothetical protein
MKNQFVVSLIFLFLLSCNQISRTKNQNRITDNNSSLLEVQNNQRDSTMNKSVIPIKDSSFIIVIRDSSDYSLSFIKSLSKPGNDYWKYYLDSNLLIINDHDSAKFPNVPPLGQTIHLANQLKDLEINLTVKRISQSTIEYVIESKSDNKTLVVKKGIADLYPVFYFGTEEDKDDLFGNYYSSIEYWDIHDSLHTAIRIGEDPKKKGTFLGKIKVKIGSIKIDLDNFPTLIEK